MALYEAIEVKETGDTEDAAFEGVEVIRDKNGNVKSITVKERYAGAGTNMYGRKEAEKKNRSFQADRRRDMDNEGDPSGGYAGSVL